MEPTDAPLVFHSRAKFWWKTGYLTVVTLAFIPILLWQHESAAALYIGALAVIHLASLVVFVLGVKKEDIAPTRRGLWNRVAGLLMAGGLLYLVSKGLQTTAQSWIFWGSLFAIWLIHTLALMMLHLRGRAEQQACPFV